jgi:hypothetical protein
MTHKNSLFKMLNIHKDKGFIRLDNARSHLIYSEINSYWCQFVIDMDDKIIERTGGNLG